MEYSIKEIIDLLRKRLVLIIICTFAGLCAFFIVSKYIMNSAYTASVQLYVNANDSATSADLNELNYAQKVVTTYISFLNTKVFFSKVIDECNSDYTSSQLKGMTSIQSVNNTEIFQISVTSSSPKDSFELVEMMQKIAPELIKSIKDTAKISVVDPAVFPTFPSSPNIMKNTLIGGMLGFILSILTVILLDVIDIKVKNQEDLSNRYQLPILGAIPNFDVYDNREFTIKKFSTILKKLIPVTRKPKHSNRINNSLNEDTRFIIAEAYKSFRTNLRFTLCSDQCKKIIISSPVPEDGKSTTNTNIGITIAETGAKVLLIDCDLRKGSLHSFFNLKHAPGVSDILSGMVDVNDTINNTAYENLQVITMGSVPPNPAELLASNQLEELLEKLEKEYDYIIIDTPPVNVVSDSLSLVKLVDGVVLVVREHVTSHPNIATALTKLKFVDTCILGLVINGVNLNQNKESKSHYYYNYNVGNNND